MYEFVGGKTEIYVEQEQKVKTEEVHGFTEIVELE